jgi:hypothetical protein
VEELCRVVRPYFGGGGVEVVVLVKLSSVWNHSCIRMSSSGRLEPVLVGVDIATKIITCKCR